MSLQPLVLLSSSRTAGVELTRRLAATGQAVAGVYAMTLRDLARAIAEPALLGRGLKAWDPGHAALVAARLLDGPHGLALPAALPVAPLAAALARTLTTLRRAGVAPAALAAVAAGRGPEAGGRLAALAGLYRAYHDAVDGRFADPATLLRAAAEHAADVPWLAGGQVLILDDLELPPLERTFLEALARAVPVRRVANPLPSGLAGAGFSAWAARHGVADTAWSATPLAAVAPAAPAGSLARLRTALFEPPAATPLVDDGVAFVTGAGEAAEVRAVARRLLAEAARGVPFEQMGLALPRPDEYAPLVSDLFARLGVPYRVHPSLPLRFGRASRALLLLFRCRGLSRAAVMEFLTFAPVPFAELLGEGVPARPARWDAVSREAGIVAGYERWIIGLRATAEAARDAAVHEASEERRQRLENGATDAEALLRVVELLSSTLDALAGEADWVEWAQRVGEALRQWIGPEHDRDALAEVVSDLASLASVTGGPAPWRQVEEVLEARLDDERLPVDPIATGAIHVGAFDAIAGLPFRVLAIPGLVEGGYPGALRPDPFLLDDEREALFETLAERRQAAAGPPPGPRRQLSLFEASTAAAPSNAPDAFPLLATAQDRLVEARRAFHRAVCQASERLILSYPRADPRSGRERLPSSFFVAAAAALAGRPLGAADLAEMTVEDDLHRLSIDDALEASERDRARVLRGGAEAVLAVAAGAPFFKWSHLAARERWSDRLTAHDGLVAGLPSELAARLDPLTAPRAASASSLATYAKCGFQYLLRYVLDLRPIDEPEERLGLDALEQGSLFHKVAELFLRERRDQGALPVVDDEPTRTRLLEIARERVALVIAGTPPRHRLVWEMRWSAFEDLLRRWLSREAASAAQRTPAHFEVGFGSARAVAAGEPHAAEPLVVDLGDGRTLRVAGQIDRVDVRPDGALVLRDYKTGRAPKDDGSVFRGGRELQIPMYVLATRMLFPGRVVAEAYLDYVNGGRPMAFDPASVSGDSFRRLLGDLVAAIASGAFVQEPSACTFCDYTAVCGPQPLIELRRRYKGRDARVNTYQRLRDYR